MLSLTSPVETPYHRLPVGAKLLALAALTFALFLTDSLAAHLAVLALVGAAVLWPGLVFARELLRGVRPIRVFVLLILAWHLWTGEPALGLRISLRLVSLVAAATLVTMTSRLDDMIALVTRAARPLRHVGISPGAVGLAIALFLRFVPVLTDKGTRLAEAWRARSRKRPGWRLAVPVTLLALDDAEQVAEALRARGGVPEDRGEPWNATSP